MTTKFEGASRSDIFLFPPENLILIGLDTNDGPEHPLYDPRVHLPVNEGMVQTMLHLGQILEPVKCRKNGPLVEVMSGRQRVKAAREANRRILEANGVPLRIPAIIEKPNDIRAFEMMVVENESRVDDTWMIKAQKAQWYINRGHTEEEAAVIFCCTPQTIKLYLSLLDLDEEVQGYVTSGKISATAATALAALTREEQKVEAKKLLESGGKVTINNVRHAVRKAKAQKDGEATPIFKAPSRKVLKRILKGNAELAEEDQLPADFTRAIRYVLGELSPSSVKGLSALLSR